MEIVKPTLLVNKEKVMHNIKKMAQKADSNGIRFRPHFKTHQSAQVGQWFRKYGVKAITVSSADMALYFAGNGWRDITIAFPVNIREIERINQLALRTKLGLLVESLETVRFLDHHLQQPVGIWLKIDVGSHRTGIDWQNTEKVISLGKAIQNSNKLDLKGLLAHTGHAYNARSKQELVTIHNDSVARLNSLRDRLQVSGIEKIELSIGDTPTCSVVDDFTGVDEIRPGNFVFYDITQVVIGSCSEEEVAVAVACPVVAKHENRNTIVLYGGAVHFSKDSVELKNGEKIFGKVCLPLNNGWDHPAANANLISVSQEHGIIRCDPDLFHRVFVGDILYILPVHSCLTVNEMRMIYTTAGDCIKTMLVE